MGKFIFNVIFIIIVFYVVKPMFLGKIDDATKQLTESSLKRAEERVNKK